MQSYQRQCNQRLSPQHRQREQIYSPSKSTFEVRSFQRVKIEKTIESEHDGDRSIQATLYSMLGLVKGCLGRTVVGKLIIASGFRNLESVSAVSAMPR